MQSIGKAVVWGESSGSLWPTKANQQEGLLTWLMYTYSFHLHIEDSSVVSNLTLY